MALLLLLLWSATMAPAQASAMEFVVTGRLDYVDGDRLLVACGRREPCMETLIRDEWLQRRILGLQGRRLTLRVERVAACGPQSSQVACIQSQDRTALRIIEWISPSPRRPAHSARGHR